METKCVIRHLHQEFLGQGTWVGSIELAQVFNSMKSAVKACEALRATDLEIVIIERSDGRRRAIGGILFESLVRRMSRKPWLTN